MIVLQIFTASMIAGLGARVGWVCAVSIEKTIQELAVHIAKRMKPSSRTDVK